MQKISHIGIVAGDKNLPSVIVDWAKKNKIKCSVVGLEGCVDKNLKDKIEPSNYKELHISQLTKTIKFFKSKNVDTLVIVGGVNNTSVKITFDVIKVFTKLLFMKNKYDAVLRIVIKEFEKAEFNVVGIQDLIPEMLIENKVLTKTMPNKKNIDDAKFGFVEAKKFANTDKGQSIIVNNKKVIATEKFSGTDALIKRASQIENSKGSILVKVIKPQQEKRVDIPVLGTNTIRELYNAGFDGVVIEANNAIIDNRKEVINLADKLNIFIMGTDGKF